MPHYPDVEEVRRMIRRTWWWGFASGAVIAVISCLMSRIG